MKRLSITQQIDHAFEQQEQRIAQLEAEVKHWEDKYWAEVFRGIEHSNIMMNNFMKVAIEGVLAPKENTHGS